VDWEFNAWGGLVDGLYFLWDSDDLVAQKVCDLERIDRYRTEGFVLEGGSMDVDGQGTVLTTAECLLSRLPKRSLPQGQLCRCPGSLAWASASPGVETTRGNRSSGRS
jgi:agmatine/peptidylarginine deiminase